MGWFGDNMQGSDAGDDVGKLKEEHQSGSSSHQYWEGMDQSHLFEWKVAEFKLLVESDLVRTRVVCAPDVRRERDC